MHVKNRACDSFVISQTSYVFFLAGSSIVIQISFTASYAKAKTVVRWQKTPKNKERRVCGNAYPYHLQTWWGLPGCTFARWFRVHCLISDWYNTSLLPIFPNYGMLSSHNTVRVLSIWCVRHARHAGSTPHSFLIFRPSNANKNRNTSYVQCIICRMHSDPLETSVDVWAEGCCLVARTKEDSTKKSYD